MGYIITCLSIQVLMDICFQFGVSVKSPLISEAQVFM